jgi:DNA polymerase elongation subunit (family B)
MDKLIITKSLRSNYKNPNQIAHKVLADRIGKRDPGNKPSAGDRIPFVYVQTREKKALQGDKIETPSYINENKLTPDYSFYITNQIMKPVQQLFALVLEQIPEFKSKRSKVRDFKANLDKHRKLLTPSKFEEKEEKIRNAEIKKLLFDKYLNEIDNVKNKNRNITNFFSVKK